MIERGTTDLTRPEIGNCLAQELGTRIDRVTHRARGTLSVALK